MDVTSEIKSGNRNQMVDVLRTLAAFVVVFIHTPEVSSDYSIHLFWLRFFPPANAIFAVLAGWFMVQSLERRSSRSSTTLGSDKHTGSQSFLKDRSHRILIPYLVWSVIYVCANCIEKAIRGKPFIYDFTSVSCWGGLVFGGGASAQLWFLVFLLYGQCCFYIWYLSARNIKWFGVMTFLMALVFSIGHLFVEPSSFLKKFLFMLKYLFWGSSMLLYGKVLLVRYQRMFFFCSVLGICLHIACVCLNTASPITEFLPILYVCAAFSFPHVTVPKWLSNMGTASMGIYVVHSLVIALGTLVFSKISFLNGGHIALLCLTMVYFLISYGVVLVLRKTRLPGV